MTTLNTPEVKPSITPPAPPRKEQVASSGDGSRRRFTRAEYYQLYEFGLFDGQKVELIGGEIFQMAPQSNLHAVAIEKTAAVLRFVFGNGYWIRPQFTLDLTDDSSPDPDIAVVSGKFDDWAKSKDNPTTALLVVEVSVTTGPYDKGIKASLYAKAGIADYWVVDVPKKQVQVRRKPAADEAQPFGFGYSELRTLDLVDEISPLALPEAKVKVADLLPA